MVPGNVFTIEPILLMRHGQYQMWKDNFTVVSPDNPSGILFFNHSTMGTHDIDNRKWL